MEKSFFKAVKKYYSIVEESCWNLMRYIEKIDHVHFQEIKELYNYLIINHKFEFLIGEKQYIRHGNGMMIVYEDSIIVNWNFGHSNWTCGIDPYFMAQTLKSHCYAETQYYEWEFIKNRCDEYREIEVMYFYNGQYFFELPKIKSFTPPFPLEYDKMKVVKNGFSKTVYRNKSLEKFIRKSHVIFENMHELQNNYILIFYIEQNEVARILYNEIGFPKAAVKIMNEEILTNN